jgi:hypothetical protein
MQMKELFHIFQNKGKMEFKFSNGKVQNYCTLHSKTRDSNKNTQRRQNNYVAQAVGRIMGSLLKPPDILMNIIVHQSC